MSKKEKYRIMWPVNGLGYHYQLWALNYKAMQRIKRLTGGYAHFSLFCSAKGNIIL